MGEEMPVVRDDDTNAIKVFQHDLDGIFGVKVEVIRWLIHDYDVGPREEHLRESDLRTFTSGERRDCLVPFFVLHEESSEHRPYFLRFFMMFTELFHDGRFRIEIC